MEDTKIEVGEFSYDLSTGTISGPADYVRERLDDYIAEIGKGRHEWLFAFAPKEQRIERTILVGIQTDYAAFRGSRETFARLEGGSR